MLRGTLYEFDEDDNDWVPVSEGEDHFHLKFCQNEGDGDEGEIYHVSVSRDDSFEFPFARIGLDEDPGERRGALVIIYRHNK